MTVAVVFTEVESQLTAARARNYVRLLERLTAASGQAVDAAHYEEVDPGRFRRASSIVLSGSSAPWANHEPAALAKLGEAILTAGRPVLGICAGMQLQALFAGGKVTQARVREHGFLPIRVHDDSDLFRGLADEVVVFQDHTDEIAELPEGFRVLASSAECEVQAIADSGRRWWGTQFHPEEFVDDYAAGEQVLRTFFALAA